MSVTHFGGGGDGPWPGGHSVDGDTIHRWTWNGTTDDTGSENATWSGGVNYGPYDRFKESLRNDDAPINHTDWRATAGAATKVTGAITVALWVWVDAYPSGNIPLIGCRDVGGDALNPSAYNFLWELGIQADGKVRAWHQHSDKQVAQAEAPAGLTKGEWHHLVATRTADGTAWYLYDKAVLVASATGLTPADGGSAINLMRFCGNGAGVYAETYMAEGIVKTVYLDQAGVDALYADAQTA